MLVVKKNKQQRKKQQRPASSGDIVQRVLSRMSQKSSRIYVAPLLDIVNASNVSNFATNTFPLTPYTNFLTIAQGTGQGERSGNSIRVHDAEFRFVMSQYPYTVTSNTVPMPQLVQVFIWSSKYPDQTLTTGQSNAVNDFFDNNTSDTGFSGITSDLVRPINEELITVHFQRLYKLGAAAYVTNTGTQANSYSYENNDFSLSITDRIPLPFYPKKIVFNDAATVPSCKTLFCTVNTVDFDGGANADTTAAIPAYMKWSVITHISDML